MLDPYVIVPMLLILLLAVFASYFMVALLVYVRLKDGIVPSLLWLVYPLIVWLKTRKVRAPVNPLTLLTNEILGLKLLMTENLVTMKLMLQGKGPAFVPIKDDPKGPIKDDPTGNVIKPIPISDPTAPLLPTTTTSTTETPLPSSIEPVKQFAR
jgi:hypothetical protein